MLQQQEQMHAQSTNGPQTILQGHQNGEFHRKMFQKSHHLQYVQNKTELENLKFN